MSDKSLENGEEKVSDSSSNKRMKEMSVDRLSDLPDSILIHILSFLGVQKSAVTSVLSKRWKYIWTELPSLEFKDWSKESHKKREFVANVNRTLLIRSSTHLEKFGAYFRYDSSFVDSWLEFAVKNKAKEVCLSLGKGVILILDSEPNYELYDIPEILYSNSSLTRFSVDGCLMETLTKIEWPSLTQLEINGSELPQHVIENILSGCPVLHTLYLAECWGFKCLDVKSQNLYELTVYALADGEDEPLLEISAPYVQTLDIMFNPKAMKLVLRNIKSLVSATINFTDDIWWSEEIVTSTQPGTRLFEELVINGWQLPVSRRKCLTVHMLEDEDNISGFFALLKFSPNLESLVIVGFELDGETWDEAATGDLDCDLMHLKTVKISNFANPAFDGEPMLTVARNLLKRAMVLEEMTTKIGHLEINDYIKICQTLLTYSRASGKAVI